MSSRNAKRKRWCTIKDIVMPDLHNLAITTSDFNNDLQEAIDFFVELFKTMENRHSEIFAQSIGIQEKYGAVMDVLQGGDKAMVGESSEQKAEIPTAYTGNVRKFLDDTSTSLKGHAVDLKDKMEEMLSTFQAFADSWVQKIKDLNVQAEQMVENRGKLSILLDDFSRNI